MTTVVSPPVNQQFIGYYLAGGVSASPQSCAAGSTYTISGKFADCCSPSTAPPSTPTPSSASQPSSTSGSSGSSGISISLAASTPIPSVTSAGPACTWRNSCIDTSKIRFGPSDTRYCNAGFQCHTQTIFNVYPPPPQQTPLSKIICVEPNYSAFTVYGTVNIAVNPTRNPPPPSTAKSTRIDNSEQTAKPTATPAPEPASKAWIAGAVVGPVVALAIIAGLIAYIIALKKRKSADYNAVPVVQEHEVDYKPQYMPSPHESWAGMNTIGPGGYPVQHQMNELGGKPVLPQELPGDSPITTSSVGPGYSPATMSTTPASQATIPASLSTAPTSPPPVNLQPPRH